jgi:Fe-S-cluster containining protein
MPHLSDELTPAVRSAALRNDVIAAVAEVYREAQSAIDARRPLCVISGRCCRFEEYGHRLYVTTLELAAFVAQVGEVRKDAAKLMADWDGTGCPFQVAKLCSVHGIRPFGCRMFFCDATSTQWQGEQYERFHGRLQELHKKLNVPYFYVEWRQGLRALIG